MEDPAGVFDYFGLIFSILKLALALSPIIVLASLFFFNTHTEDVGRAKPVDLCSWGIWNEAYGPRSAGCNSWKAVARCSKLIDPKAAPPLSKASRAT
ncbi:hypothetical protein BESB_024070 [Besnoitia besnoiti]|uniref:Transmembrane protein n=1 Tax=Besnoitia besnoiti TaxID=94643 RepID=A0A2A9M1Q0_BESBE|nr:hypothetical protein BESB_024070 [Besnoitia besnoiti]PFH31915.1 hypothetical protein BESB_024070 [Besnoitia besnoiti]